MNLREPACIGVLLVYQSKPPPCIYCLEWHGQYLLKKSYISAATTWMRGSFFGLPLYKLGLKQPAPRELGAAVTLPLYPQSAERVSGIGNSGVKRGPG